MRARIDRAQILATCLIKNEADIIAECLTAAATWCDAIFIFDNGSDDGTWEIVLDLARTVDCLIPFTQDSTPFRDSLRGEIFEHFRNQSVNGDWWCALAADEFYIDNPRIFLNEIPSRFDVVWSASFQYYFTERDLARYESAPEAFENLPIDQKCRYYVNNRSEPRFFRYSDVLSHRNRNWPHPLGSSFGERIRLKHFQYRSPRQIAKRLLTRRRPMDEGFFGHEAAPDWCRTVALRQANRPKIIPFYRPSSWRERIVDSRYLNFDSDMRTYTVNDNALPPIF